jgi:hypothetical protein
MSASASSSCSTCTRSLSDERPNVSRSNFDSRALSASISKRCSIRPECAVASSAFCASTIACKLATSVGRAGVVSGIARDSPADSRRSKENPAGKRRC